MDSILISVKKMLGLSEEYEQFDPDIIMHINSVFAILNQLGVGPEIPFTITNESTKWNEFIPDGKNLELVKTYLYMKVRLMFDPPTSSVVMECVNKQISELEFRMNLECD